MGHAVVYSGLSKLLTFNTYKVKTYSAVVIKNLIVLQAHGTLEIDDRSMWTFNFSSRFHHCGLLFLQLVDFGYREMQVSWLKHLEHDKKTLLLHDLFQQGIFISTLRGAL